MKILAALKKLFSSSNNFFHQEDHFIFQGKSEMDIILQLWGYELSERGPYRHAYDYFVKNPEQFDGATMTEELCDIPWLDLDAMLHDYLYVGLNASASLKYMWKADKLLRQEMRRKGKSSWNTGYRFTMLVLKTPFFLPWCWLIKGRRISDEQRRDLNIIFALLEKEDSRPWHKKYRGELSWFLFFLFLFMGYIWRIHLLKFFWLF